MSPLAAALIAVLPVLLIAGLTIAYLAEQLGQEREAHVETATAAAIERRQMLEAARQERQELLVRIQHPEAAVTYDTGHAVRAAKVKHNTEHTEQAARVDRMLAERGISVVDAGQDELPFGQTPVGPRVAESLGDIARASVPPELRAT